MSELQRWKHKALRLAKELDEQQACRENTEKLLARTLIRLTLVYEGCRPSTDDQLVRLREILRKGILDAPRLKQVDELTEAILRQDGGETADVSWQTALVEFLLDCAPSAAERARLQRLAQRRITDPEKLKQALREIFGDGERRSVWSVFQRWFGRSTAAEADDPPVWQRHLLSLVAEIEVPAALTEERERLTELLRQPGQVAEALEETARLLAAINRHLQHERAEIEEFLGQLSGRLQNLETQTQDVGRIFLQGDRDWNDRLSAQVDRLRVQTLEETDLEALKMVVTERLDVLSVQLQTLREAEERRNREAEQKIAELTRRLRELEQESQDLRQRLRLAHQQALRDPLTGLPNRRAVDERLEQEFARWRRFGEPFSLLVWDIDHFKKINDRFGHQAGDKALRVVAQVLRQGGREVDFVGRYGGEEFLMLLPGTAGEGGLTVAEKLRRAVKNCGFNSRGKPVPITLSCGLSSVREGDLQTLFDRADQALYRAKREGRDRCVAA